MTSSRAITLNVVHRSLNGSKNYPGDSLIERGLLVRHEPAMRSLTVSNVDSPSPSFRRLTFTGEDLQGFASLGATDHVTVIVGDGLRRDYTPRAFREAVDGASAELDVDFFLHGNGQAASWAASRKPGDSASLSGPRGSRLPPKGATRFILGADESSLPALARWIEILPDDAEIFGFAEVANPSDAAYLDPELVHKARIVWLDKSEGVLERAIRSMGPIDDQTLVWVAGEAHALVPTRRYLRRELCLPPQQLTIDGYWKSGEAGRDHHSPIDPSDPDDEAPPPA